MSEPALFVNSEGTYFAILNGAAYQVIKPDDLPDLKPGYYDKDGNPVDGQGNPIDTKLEDLGKRVRLW